MDCSIYLKQQIGLTDANGRKLSEKDIPRIRPGEVKSFDLSLLDYSFEVGDIISATGDTDINGSTASKLVGSDAEILAVDSASFTLSTTEGYSTYWDAINNAGALVVLFVQLKILKLDGRIHKLVFQLRGAPSVDGSTGAVPNPDYVTDAELAQQIAQLLAQVNQWLYGTGAPDNGTGNNGGWYIDTATGNLYRRALGVWGASIMCIKGEQGTVGSLWLVGTGVPSNAIGNDGDLYLRDTGLVYAKAAGSWSSTGVSIVGPAGAAGSRWYHSTGVPSDAVGVDGDYCLRNTGAVYLKASGAWGDTGVSLAGPAGTGDVTTTAANVFTIGQTIDLAEAGTALSIKLATVETIRLEAGGRGFFAGGVVMAGANLATDATDGFCHIPACYGKPTGNPVAHTGTAPLVFDNYNKKLYYHDANGWQPVTVAVRCETYVIMDPATAYAKSTKIPIMCTSMRPISIGYIEVSVDGTVNQVTGNLRYADDLITFANAVTVDIFDTTSGTGKRADGNIASPDVPAVKWLYLDFTAAPNAAIKYMAISISWTE